MLKKSFILLILFCLGCKDSGGQGIVDSVKDRISSATDQLSPLASGVASQTSEQASKVLRYEYKVTSIPSVGTTDQSLESVLNKLGEERWECFSVLPTDTGIRITCRRVPYAALRYFLKLM